MNIDTQKQKLQDELNHIVSELEHIGRQESTGNWVAVPDQGDDEQYPDELDVADLKESYQERVALVRVLEEQYIQINKALQAIKDGTYGICEVSGNSISEKRLIANPSATTCIEHAK